MNIKTQARQLAASVALTVLVAPAVALGQWDQGLANAQSGGTPQGTLIGIIKTTMNWLLAVLGFFGIIGFVISGIMYLTAAGDEDRMEKAKNTMMWSIMGVIVALIGFVIIQAVNTWLGGSSTNF